MQLDREAEADRQRQMAMNQAQYGGDMGHYGGAQNQQEQNFAGMGRQMPMQEAPEMPDMGNLH